MPRVSVAIVTYNRKQALAKAIASVYEQGEDAEVVVVDNHSSDGTPAAVSARFPDIKYFRLPRNFGCVGGRNYIYPNCTGDFIVNLDDDGYLGAGALQRVIALFESDPSIGIIAMRRVDTDGAVPVHPTAADTATTDVGSFSGGLSAFRRTMLEQIGYYPEDFFYFAEESYLSLRAMDAGYRIVLAPDIIMWHPRLGPSSGTQWDYYRMRNALLVVLRLFPGWLMVKYLVLRSGSQLLFALRRGTPVQYLRAIAHVLWHLPGTLLDRQPCRAGTVEKHLRLQRATRAVASGPASFPPHVQEETTE